MKRIAVTILGVLSIAVAAGLVFSAYGGVADPLNGTLPALAALTFPVWLIAAAVLVVTGLFWWRKGAVILLAAALISWPSIRDFWPVHTGAEQKAAQAAFSLMTYNVQGFVNFTAPSDPAAAEATVRFILEQGCDIVALQECTSFNHSAIGALPHEVTDSLKKAYPYRLLGPHGQAILSRYPAVAVAADNSDMAVGVWRVSVPGGDVTVINVHLRSLGLTASDKTVYRNLTRGAGAPVKQELSDMRHAVLPKLSAAFRDRARQAAAVREIVQQQDGPVIVCGDFNDVTGCYSCREIKNAGLCDVYAAAGNGPAITYHDNRFYFRIDHIFCSGELMPVYARVDRNPTSDHYPLTAFFDFVREAEVTGN